METTTLNVIIPSVLTLIGTLAGSYLLHKREMAKHKDDLELAKQIKDLDKNRRIAFELGVTSMAEQGTIHREMEAIYSLGIGRILRLAIRNGGSIPRVGSVLKAFSLDAVAPSPAMSAKIVDKYDGVKVDSAYAEMCAQIASKLYDPEYYYHVIVPAKPKNKEDAEKERLTLLQAFYRSEKIKEAYIYGLAIDVFNDKKTGEEKFVLYILSVAIYENQITDKETWGLKDIDKANLYISIDKIRAIYRKYYPYIPKPLT